MDPADHLPPLVGDPPVLRASSPGNRTSHLIDQVRHIARDLRGDKSRRFYSVREMATHFRVSVGTIAAIYQRLEQEGILARIRGSKTLLVGRQLSPRIPVRAVIGIVALRFSMIAHPDARELDMELIERLSRRGYVADLIFHTTGDINEPALVEHLVRHRVDFAIIRPTSLKIRQNILALRDHGIRTITIQDKLLTPDLPALIYQQDWAPAYEHLAHKWHSEGIRRVVVPMKPEFLSSLATTLFQSIFTAAGINVEFCTHDFATLLRAARSRRVGVAFLDRFRAGRICDRQPLEAERLLKSTRVAFCRGSVYVPYFSSRRLTADLVVFSSSRIADRIARDLGRTFDVGDGIRHVFTADFIENAPFQDPSDV